MKKIDEAGDLKGKRVLLRVDWNTPLSGGVVADDFRIKATRPTLEKLISSGAKVIIATHFEGNVEPLRPFVPEGVELLPNLRDNPGEEGNSPEFAKELAVKADIFVNEAFSVSHRAHASIVGVPKLLPSYAGSRFVEEFENLSKVFSPTHPFLLLLGGAKIETKLPLVEKFSSIADDIFIGGAMAKRAFEMNLGYNPKVFFPTGDLSALDANDETIEILKEKIGRAGFIVWNGPLGKYEDGYVEHTHKLALAVAASEAHTIVGGGDTLAVIKDLDLFDKYSFVSTAGGAMLDFLAKGTLPGIVALDSTQI